MAQKGRNKMKDAIKDWAAIILGSLSFIILIILGILVFYPIRFFTSEQGSIAMLVSISTFLICAWRFHQPPRG